MSKLKRRALESLSPKHIAESFGTKQVYKKFADTHSLVYFGMMDRQNDEYRLVKGVTVSTSHHDSHYCVGSVSGRDLILLERQDTLRLHQGKKDEVFTWTILQIDLRPDAGLAHAFLDGHHHSSLFYSAVFAKLGRLSPMNEHFFVQYEPEFTSHFTSYTSLESTGEFTQLVTPGTAAVLAHHFNGFDFEWQDDTLLVYLRTKKPTAHDLDYMLRAGIWLANELEAPQLISSYGL